MGSNFHFSIGVFSLHQLIHHRLNMLIALREFDGYLLPFDLNKVLQIFNFSSNTIVSGSYIQCMIKYKELVKIGHRKF